MQREASKSPEYLSTERNGFVYDRDTYYCYPRTACLNLSGEGRNSVTKVFVKNSFSSFAFVIAMPETRGQLFFLQGANASFTIHDGKKQMPEDCK